MKKKAIAILVAATMVMTSMVSLTGCKKDEQPKEAEKQAAKFTGTKIYKTTNGKMKTLNPHTYTSSTESKMMGSIMSTFTEFYIDEKNEVKEYPTMAKEFMKASEDKKVWTVKLREGLKFTDGTPIDAETYMTSFKYALDPNMKNYRADFFFGDITIVNAKEYWEGKCKNWQDVGVKALDKQTLQFTFGILASEPEMKSALNSISLLLINPKIYEKYMAPDKKSTKYGTSMETIQGAEYGSYKMSEWIFDQSYKMEKNKDFPLIDFYTPDILETRVVEDSSTRIQLFEKGDIDVAGIPSAAYDKYKEDPRLLFSATTSVTQMNINSKSTTNPVLQDVNFRRAMFYGMDRSKIANDIFKTARPAGYLISTKFTANQDGKSVPFRETKEAKENVPKNNGFDEKLAKEYFEKAYAANGSKKIVVTLLYDDSSEAIKSISEFLKSTYEKNFGADKLEFKLQATPPQINSENLSKGKYDIAFAAWNCGTASNPVSRFGVYPSSFGDKRDTFANKEFDDLYDRCTKGDWIFNEKEKFAAALKMEKIMIDDATVIPVWEPKSPQMFSDKLKLRLKKYNADLDGFGTMQAEFTR